METTNPLFNLSQTHKEKLFAVLRGGLDFVAVDATQFNGKLPVATEEQANEFFKIYARERWGRRLDRAATEADAITGIVSSSPSKIPEAVLAALGQEAFNQIAGGKVDVDDLARYTALFLRAREQDLALQFQNKKFLFARRNATEKALDAFARELPKNPEAQAAFENLKAQLLTETDHLPEDAP